MSEEFKMGDEVVFRSAGARSLYAKTKGVIIDYKGAARRTGVPLYIVQTAFGVSFVPEERMMGKVKE